MPPQKLHIEVLTSNTCECDLIGNRILGKEGQKRVRGSRRCRGRGGEVVRMIYEKVADISNFD